jgi:hypothetical protein
LYVRRLISAKGGLVIPGVARDPGGLEIVEHCRLVEENPAHSKVFFHKKVNFHILTDLPGLVRCMVLRWRTGAADAGDLGSG